MRRCLNKLRSPRLAMVTWSRNCERFLAANLAYHFRLGVRRAYVFLDRCTDASERIAHGFPWVRTFVLDPLETATFDYIPDVQAICMNQALSLARREGFEWLLALDPDEFAYADENVSLDPDGKQTIAHGHLAKLLKQVPADIEVVRLQTKELIPLDLGDDAPFWKQRFFQFRNVVPRDIADPLTGKVQHCERFIGHVDGKSILRTSADAQAYDPHQWVCHQERQYPHRPEYVPLKYVWRGALYHFHLVSQRHWREKHTWFGREPNVSQDGTPQEFPKPCWKAANAQLSDDELGGYFARWVAMPEAELGELVRQGHVSEERTVEHVLRQSGYLNEGTGELTEAPVKGRASSAPFRLLPQPAVTRRTDSLTYRMANVDPVLLDGFHGLERSGSGELFRWSKPTARVKLSVPRSDYLLTIDMKDYDRLWNGRLRLYVNDRHVQDCVRTTPGGGVRVRLHCDDFAESDEHWLRMVFEPVDTSRWPNRDSRNLGAPIFGISLQPL